jgi:hypothetical protein
LQEIPLVLKRTAPRADRSVLRFRGEPRTAILAGSEEPRGDSVTLKKLGDHDSRSHNFAAENGVRPGSSNRSCVARFSPSVDRQQVSTMTLTGEIDDRIGKHSHQSPRILALEMTDNIT